MAKRKKKILIPLTPLTSRGTRDPEYVVNVVLRMGEAFVDHLDSLCKINGRSRREVVEILIAEASVELQEDVTARINPL